MATLKDVAEKAGITVTTVSRVLNNRGYISDKTREKVYAAMRELNYRPNEVARSLSKKRTNVIGVIVPSVLHPYFSKVVHYLERSAAAKDYKIMLCVSNHEKEKEIEYIDMLRSNKVAGIVICSRTVDIGEYLDLGMPVVTFERELPGGIVSVSCDNRQGGSLATRHLLECGCRRLLHISGSRNVPIVADQRGAAFEEVCREAGVDGTVYHTEEAQFLSMDYTAFIEKIIADNVVGRPADERADGVFASSDVIAAQVLQACARFGVRVPEELRVVGFDDVEIAALTIPTITTIRQPVEDMCRYTISHILRRLDGETVPTRTVLPVQLIARGSTAAV